MIRRFASLMGMLARKGRPFARDERGVTAVEFGLLAIPFFWIVGGILQTSTVFLATQVLESAVNDAARNVRTGEARGTSLEDFRTSICDRLFGLFPDCSGLHIRINRVTDFQSATVTPPVDHTCLLACPWTQSEVWDVGGTESVMLAQVYYRYPILIQWGPLGMANLADGNRLLGTATVFKNEPY